MKLLCIFICDKKLKQNTKICCAGCLLHPLETNMMTWTTIDRKGVLPTDRDMLQVHKCQIGWRHSYLHDKCTNL